MTALITGATAGIGLAFCEVLAQEGTPLVVVARDTARLEDIARRLSSAHGISVQVLPADLATEPGCQRVMDRLTDADAPIDLLVNNAGFGLNQDFVGGDLAEEERLLDVLVRATLRLTHAALPGMVDRGSGAILNVSSVAGWTPIGTYSAAKSWVTVFTEGLAAELAGTGVSATAVCPGFTRTEFHERAAMEMPGVPEWAWLDARRVAQEGLGAARAGRPVSVPSKRYTSLALALQYTPRPVLRRATALVGRTRGPRR
jgi:short-subunit dehydrogenase